MRSDVLLRGLLSVAMVPDGLTLEPSQSPQPPTHNPQPIQSSRTPNYRAINESKPVRNQLSLRDHFTHHWPDADNFRFGPLMGGTEEKRFSIGEIEYEVAVFMGPSIVIETDRSLSDSLCCNRS